MSDSDEQLLDLLNDNQMTELEKEKMLAEAAEKQQLQQDKMQLRSKSKITNFVVPDRSALEKKQARTVIPMDQLLRIQVTFEEISQWAYLPFFEDLIMDCFVRAHFGDHFKIFKVENVEIGEEYSLDARNRINKNLFCRRGLEKMNVPLTQVSDKAFTLEEYEEYVEQMDQDDEPMILSSLLKRKAQALEERREIGLTDEEITLLVESKKKFNGRIGNTSFEKADLLGKLKAAKSEGKQSLVEEIEKKISELTKVKKGVTEQAQVTRLKITKNLNVPLSMPDNEEVGDLYEFVIKRLQE